MMTSPEELRAKARTYRERADRELHDPVVTEAFYQIANTLDRRAALAAGASLQLAPHGLRVDRTAAGLARPSGRSVRALSWQ